MHKMTQATSITPEVKLAVWHRDRRKCIICGKTTGAEPNAHYISRAQGGLGIEENIVTLCYGPGSNHCHDMYDNGDRKTRMQFKNKIREYLQSKYPDWREEDLVYDKWRFYNV